MENKGGMEGKGASWHQTSDQNINWESLGQANVRTSWEQVLTQTILSIRQAPSLEEIFQVMVDQVQQLLGCDRALIYRFLPDWSGKVIIEAVSDPQWSLLHQIIQDPCFPSSGLKACRWWQTFAVDDIDQAELTPCHANFLASFHVKANLIVPLFNGDDLWGLFIVHQCTDPRPWQPEEVKGLQQLALHGDIAIHQATLGQRLELAQTNLEAVVKERAQELVHSNPQRVETVDQPDQAAVEVTQRGEFLQPILADGKQVAAKPRDQAETLRIFYESSPLMMGLVETSEDDILHLCDNPAALKFFGKTAEEFAHHWASAVGIPQQVRQLWLSHYRQSQQQNRPVQFDYEHITSHQSYWLLVTVSFVGMGTSGRPQFSYIVQDLSEKKQLEGEKALAFSLLHDSQQLYASLVSSLPVGVFRTDQEGQCVYVNERWSQLAGIELEQALGEGWVQAVHPEDREMVLTAWLQAVAEQRPLELEHRYQSTTGQISWVYGQAVPAYNTEGEPMGYLGTITDITDRKQIEAERLRAETARMKLTLREQILDVVLAGYWDWDIAGGTEYLSPGFKRMFGYEDHELPNSPDTWQTLIFPEDLPIALDNFNRHIQSHGKEPYYNEVRYRHKDGSTVWVICSGRVIEWDDHGNPLRMIGCHIDISDRKQFEERLAHSEATNRAILLAIPDLLLRVGRDGTCYDCLPPTDPTSGQFLPVRYHLSEVLPPDLLEQQLEGIEATLNDGIPRMWEHQFEKDGQLCDEEVRIVPCGQDEGLVIVRDITERKRMEAELRQSEATNRALIQAIPDFLVRMRQDGVQLEVINEGAVNFLHPSARSDVAGISIRDIMPLAIGQERIQLAQRALATGDVQKQEYEFEDQGNLYFEEARITPLNHEEVLVMVRDITERKRAIQELKTTKEQLELFIRATSEGFWDWNFTTNEIYFSPRWKEMLGYTDQELDNTLDMWESVIFEEDHAAALQLVDDYNSGRTERFSMVQRFHHKNGGEVYVLSRAIHVKDDQGKVVRMVGSHLDVTSTIHVQEALKNSEMQLSGILNSSLDGIMAFKAVRDAKGRIIDFEWLLSNPTACEIVGRETGDLIGKRMLEELPGNREEGLFDIYVQVVETGEPIRNQFHYSSDGIDTWFENISVKLGDGFAVTFRDISAIKESEQALQRANQNLELHLHDLKQRNDEMLLLSETSDFLQACRTIEEACAVISTLVQPLFPDCSGAFFITNASRNRVEQVASWGDHIHSQADFQPHDCWALRRGRWHEVGLDRQGLRCNHISATAETLHTLCIPMIAQGETLGLFYLNALNAEVLNQAKQQLARTVAEQVGLSIANLHLRETLQNQSIRDALTGLFNRRYLEESLQQEIARAQRHQSPIGVIMVDVDHFKQINDTHGHDVGDFVLKAIGQTLKDNIRLSDIACRYGGEEMTLVFPDTTLQETIKRAEELRQTINHLTIHHTGRQLDCITASFGVAVFPDHGLAGAALIQAADAALYRAKAAGRNRVVVVETPTSGSQA